MRTTWFSLLALGAALGCEQSTEKPAPASTLPSAAVSTHLVPAAPKKPSPSDVLVDRPRNAQELPTTNGAIFMGNLGGTVTAAEGSFERNPDSPSSALMLAGALMSRGKVLGVLDDLARAAEICKKALTKDEKNAKLHSMRADALAALHQFAEAKKHATRAHELEPSADTRAQLADIAWNLGDYTTAIGEIRKLAKESPGFSTIVRQAQLDFDLGDVKAAEEGFARAETQIKDPSPVPVAWLNVQRGLLHLHTGRFEQAERFYVEAVERLPDYPMAVEHLAEIEGLLGKREQAMKRYGRVIHLTDDPEFIGALAGVLEEQGRKDEAKKLRDRAEKRYDELLKKHPAAMYWHAADFFLSDAEKPKKALELLQKNLKIRPNAGSLAFLAAAELENGKVDDAEKHITEALATPVKKAEHYWTAARIALKKGDAAKAKEHEKAALALNPKITVLEGPLEEKGDEKAAPEKPAPKQE